jgi:hypothetical protein
VRRGRGKVKGVGESSSSVDRSSSFISASPLAAFFLSFCLRFFSFSFCRLLLASMKPRG